MGFGLIPEFIGRLPVIATLDTLRREDLVRILREPKRLTRQYSKLFELSGKELEFSDAALGAIADQAIERETGVRALRAILEDVLLDLLYELPHRTDTDRFVVDDEHVRESPWPRPRPEDRLLTPESDLLPRRAATSTRTSARAPEAESRLRRPSRSARRGREPRAVRWSRREAGHQLLVQLWRLGHHALAAVRYSETSGRVLLLAQLAEAPGHGCAPPAHGLSR